MATKKKPGSTQRSLRNVFSAIFAYSAVFSVSSRRDAEAANYRADDAHADLDVVGLQNRAALTAPIVVQFQDQALK